MLDVHKLVVRYGRDEVLHGVDLHVERGEIVCLLGASGCGKTTLLRTVAGLEPAAAGNVLIEGESIVSTPVHKRGFGLMFQDFALFPHLDVLHNATFGLKMKRLPRREQIERARSALELVGLAGFEGRDVSQLSGGEKQRVALARSLAPNPRLLMLDEPLGSLDAALRDRLAVDLRQIIKRVGLTAIYVTHDQQEAFAIADRIAVMNDGRIEQIDTPETLYRQPQTVFVARFLGLNNIFTRDQLAALTGTAYPAEFDYLLIHPDSIRLTAAGDLVAEGDDAHLTGHVTERVFFGGYYRLRVRINDDAEITVRVAVDDVPGLSDRVHVDLGAGAIGLRDRAE